MRARRSTGRAVLAGPRCGAAAHAAFRVRTPKYASSATDAHLEIGRLEDTKVSGTRCAAAPIAAETTLIAASAATEPTNATLFPALAANRAARKKVLSPSSERKTREKAGTAPERMEASMAL